MYGASIRDRSCSVTFIGFVNKQGKPHCPGNDHDDISFDPGFNETLSPVSSAPQRVCLCDSNGKPQCADISYIFRNTSVYRGETITLPACIVGYDFGTTVGTIHARSLYSDSHSKQDKSQLVIDSENVFLSTIPFTQNIIMNFYCYKHHPFQYLVTLAMNQKNTISLDMKILSRIKYLIIICIISLVVSCLNF